MNAHDVTVTVNGEAYEREVEARKLLVHFLRDDLDLTGTHVGCDTGNCGACTVLLDGVAVKSCMLLAVQADGAAITTVEGLASEGGLHPLQEVFRARHALQCGFCTPGILLGLVAFLGECPDPTEQEMREALSGHLCRCTGYQNIVAAALEAAAELRRDAAAP